MLTEIAERRHNERDAYRLLYSGFVVAPIVAGLDKFTDTLGNWDRYLSDEVAEKLPVRRHTFMQGVGLIEVGAGLRDIALRDVGLALSALALELRKVNELTEFRLLDSTFSVRVQGLTRRCRRGPKPEHERRTENREA